MTRSQKLKARFFWGKDQPTDEEWKFLATNSPNEAHLFAMILNPHYERKHIGLETYKNIHKSKAYKARGKRKGVKYD